jgi:hypothetical protein
MQVPARSKFAADPVPLFEAPFAELIRVSASLTLAYRLE